MCVLVSYYDNCWSGGVFLQLLEWLSCGLCEGIVDVVCYSVRS